MASGQKIQKKMEQNSPSIPFRVFSNHPGKQKGEGMVEEGQEVRY